MGRVQMKDVSATWVDASVPSRPWSWEGDPLCMMCACAQLGHCWQWPCVPAVGEGVCMKDLCGGRVLGPVSVCEHTYQRVHACRCMGDPGHGTRTLKGTKHVQVEVRVYMR